MTSIGCDCIILVIMNGYVHLGSEGGQYVGHERAAKLVPTRVPLAVSRPRARHAPLRLDVVGGFNGHLISSDPVPVTTART